jgi:hypothetical protein
MRKALIAAAAVAFALSNTSSAVAYSSPLPFRHWTTPTGSALITSCTAGNYAALFSATSGPGGAGVSGEIAFCQAEATISFGLEFFGTTHASGYFIPFDPSIGDFTFQAEGGWSGVIAVCISAGPNERLACAEVHMSQETGELSLTPIPANDARLSPSGNMYPCLSPHGPIVNPSCATCV